MNILLLTQFFSTTRGGGEYVFSVIAKNLAKNGHQVYVITNEVIGEKYPTEKNLNLILIKPTLEYKGGLPPTFIDNLRYTVNAIKYGKSLIKNKNIDIIHSNNFAPTLAGSILSFITSKPHIIAVHDIFSLCGKNYWKRWANQYKVSKLNATLAPIFEKLMLRLKHDCIHTVSEATRDDLIKFGEKKPIHVIPNSIEENNLVAASTIPTQFVFVGRLVFYKNLEVVLHAVDIVRKKLPDIRLVLVGGGPYKNDLEKIVKEKGIQANVEFRGFVEAQEKLRIIAQSNALVLPSLCEGFGLVILEAFSQKKPVLVSKIRPMSDIVSDENAGFILDPYDEKVWADSLLRLSNEPSLSEKMGKNGFDMLQTKYNQGLMYQKLMGMYNQVVTNSSLIN